MAADKHNYCARRFFLCLALPLGLALAWITPPFQAPDEPAHFCRAFQLSEGQLIARCDDTMIGVRLPVNLIEMVAPFTELCANTNNTVDLEQWLAAWSIPLDLENRAPIPFASSAFYPPLLYLPQVLGIWIGRLLGLGALGIIYPARMMSLLAYCLLFWCAIQLMPIQKWVLALVGLLPISLFQAASFSADGMAIPYCALFSASVFRVSWQAKDSSAAAFSPWWLLPLSLGLGLGKPYLPLLLLVFMVPLKRLGSGWRYTLWLAALLGACGIAMAFWHAQIRQLLIPMQPGLLSFAERWQDIVHNPRYLARALWNTWSSAGFIYNMMLQGVGVLGWLDTPLPTWYVFIYLLILALTVLGDRGPANMFWHASGRWIAGAAAIMGALFISTWLFISFTPPGVAEIFGLQGRYFLPLLPAFLVIFWHRSAGWPSWLLALGFTALGMLTTLITTLTLCQRFY